MEPQASLSTHISCSMIIFKIKVEQNDFPIIFKFDELVLCLAVSSRNTPRALGWKQSSPESPFCQARLKKLGKEKDMLSQVAASDYKGQRRKEQRRETLDSPGTETVLRQNAEHLHHKEAHETVVSM